MLFLVMVKDGELGTGCLKAQREEQSTKLRPQGTGALENMAPRWRGIFAEVRSPSQKTIPYSFGCSLRQLFHV
jgi:hypothetical protein